MAYKVIIAEKPSVAAAIARIVGAMTQHRDGATGYVEGNGYRVTWALGHLVGLKTPEQMGFGTNDIPIIPGAWQTRILEAYDNGKKTGPNVKEKQMETIGRLFGGADEIIVATDAGREGELIFRYIYEYIGCTTPFKRLWISSMTPEAIRKGLSNIQDGHAYDALSDAAHARSQADWLIGYNASMALRLYSQSSSFISLGRVQTPTLGMICERWKANRDFVATPYKVIKVHTAKDNIPFSAMSARYDNDDSADGDAMKISATGTLAVEEVERKKVTKRPPLLYDLTALQRAANVAYGLTAEQTLAAAQSLYEKRLLTYPRTGSQYIPEDVYKTIPALLRKISGHDAFGAHASALSSGGLSRGSVNDSKVTDHHALLPTGENADGITGNEKLIYDMVVARTVEAFGENSVSDTTSITLTSAGITLKAHGSVITHAGWRSVRGVSRKDDKDKEDDDMGQLPDVKEGDIIPVLKVEVQEKKDTAPPIHTEDSLLLEMQTCGKRIEDETLRESMKDSGLGTTATRAAVIETLISRRYVERDKRKLIPTSFGMSIWDIVKDRKIASVETTAEWEHRLALIEKGEQTAPSFNKDMEAFAKEIVEDLSHIKGAVSKSNSENGTPCPLCGKPMKGLRYSISCDENAGGCGLRINREFAGKALPATALQALAAGRRTAVIKGFKSSKGKSFEAALKIDPQTRRITPDFGPPVTHDGAALKCPFCDKTMKVEHGKASCSCGFEMWLVTGGKAFTEAQIEKLLKGGKVTLGGLKAKSGKTYAATFYLDRESKTIERKFVNK